jgi:hypothetical protein
VSFLADPPLLVASGAAIEASDLSPRAKRAAEAGVLAVFLGTSIGLYLEAGFTRWLWRLCRARSGRDWMLNSGVFHFDPDRAGTGTHLLAVALFALYPLWLRLGRNLGARIRPQTEAA